MKPHLDTMLDGVLGAIGHTPLVRLRHLLGDAELDVHAKLEYLNPGGSLKDRPALGVLTSAIENGVVDADTVIVESSSGNLAIGLAQVCSYLGLAFICVVDPRTTAENVAILEAYGATVDLVAAPDPATGEFLPARIQRVQALLNRHRNAYWPNQYANLQNPSAHQATMAEIVDALPHVDYLFVATSTCGTLRGCSEYIHRRGLNTRVVAVDAIGSAIFSSATGPRLLPGYGAGIRPQLLRPGLEDRLELVSDHEAVAGCRELVRREAIFAGGSSGALVAALFRLRHELEPGARCVLILADRGERYLRTIYSPQWVREHLGEVNPGVLLDAPRTGAPVA